jgi:hypothetical protein
MKLIGLMSLAQYRDNVRKFFEKHEVQIYSELDISGHTADTIKNYGFWIFDKDDSIYSVLFFAVVKKEKADEIMAGITALRQEFDAQHPPRAYQIAVEKMV